MREYVGYSFSFIFLCDIVYIILRLLKTDGGVIILKIAVCDDEWVYLDKITTFVERYFKTYKTNTNILLEIINENI